jgi:ABC-type multidrug transport system fused ATPase/permease subunit
MLKIRRIDYQAYQSLGTGKLAAQIENGAAAGKNILFDFAFNILRRLIPSVLFSMLFIFRINKYIMFSVIFGYVFCIYHYKFAAEIIIQPQGKNPYKRRKIQSLSCPGIYGDGGFPHQPQIRRRNNPGKQFKG